MCFSVKAQRRPAISGHYKCSLCLRRVLLFFHLFPGGAGLACDGWGQWEDISRTLCPPSTRTAVASTTAVCHKHRCKLCTKRPGTVFISHLLHWHETHNPGGDETQAESSGEPTHATWLLAYSQHVNKSVSQIILGFTDSYDTKSIQTNKTKPTIPLNLNPVNLFSQMWVED